MLVNGDPLVNKVTHSILQQYEKKIFNRANTITNGHIPKVYDCSLRLLTDYNPAHVQL